MDLDPLIPPLHLNDLHRIIQWLTGAIFMAQGDEYAVMLAGLQHEARLCKQEIERRLGVRD